MERRQTEIDSLLSRGRMNKPAWEGGERKDGEKRSEGWRWRGGGNER